MIRILTTIGRWSVLVMLAMPLSSSALVHAECFNTTRLGNSVGEAVKAEHRGRGFSDEYVLPQRGQRGDAIEAFKSKTSTIFEIAANTVHYYDAEGKEVSESEFETITEEPRAPYARAKEGRGPFNTTPAETRGRRGASPSRAEKAPGRVDTPPSSFEANRRKLFLWSLKTDKNTVYFLGSVHMLTKDSYPLAREIENAYEDAQKIVFETDMDGLNDPVQQGKMVMLGLYPFGQTLKQNISEETYRALKKRVDEAGLSMTQFEPFKPWMCALTLAVMELQRLGFDPSLGIDTYFFSKAKKDGKDRVFLESIEYQLDLFAKMDEEEQQSFLSQTLEELDVLETMTLDMIEAWKIGDVEKLRSIFGQSFEEHSDIYKRLVVERNKQWVSQIENMIRQDENVLVIVGAGHMVGADNILELLEQKGHRITQSTSSPETAGVFRQGPRLMVVGKRA